MRYHGSKDERVRRDKATSLLTTTYSFARTNRDINPGGFRFINLQKPPFNWPPPATKIADFVVPWPPRYLALWSRESILALPRSDR